MRIKKTPLRKRVWRMATNPFRRFRRDASGTSAIEFSIVALPFLVLLFAIIETSLVFFSGQILETAVSDSARLILTGQAQGGGLNQTTFKNAVCARITGMLDCANGVYVDVRTFSTFGSITFNNLPFDAEGKPKPADFTYQPGGAGEIVVVRLFYQFPLSVPNLIPSLVNMYGNKHLLIATAAFRNEPF
jgi:Flp pilus assembly protein TadG